MMRKSSYRYTCVESLVSDSNTIYQRFHHLHCYSQRPQDQYCHQNQSQDSMNILTSFAFYVNFFLHSFPIQMDFISEKTLSTKLTSNTLLIELYPFTV